MMIAFLLAVAGLFDYNRNAPLDVRASQVAQREGVPVADITFAAASGARTAAYLVGSCRKDCAGVLFVHWYESTSPKSNRTQFLEEALSLAPQGVISLLIETMWSDPQWYRNRNSEADYSNSVQQVRELRRALDVLLAQPGLDGKRVAYVGHDFGGMYGTLLAQADGRPTAYAIQAANTSFSDWFLYSPKREGEARRRFIEQLAPLDPVKYIGAAAGRPVLFQFAHKDFYVPKENAEAFFAAAREPKKILWYDGGHGLNEQAVTDRLAWLREVLRLKMP